jgi:hypothetical protein
MSVDQAQRNLNRIDNEIADLEVKLAAETKNEADKTRRINDIERSITNSTSASTVQSKQRQIQGFRNDLVKVATNIATISHKIAEKRRQRSIAAQNLQREELVASKRAEKSQRELQQNYEHRIAELTSQLAQNISSQVATTHLYSETGDEEYDVFLSHASEDKKSFVDDLYQELSQAGIKVWYDDMNIQWGDSLRAKIDNGLKKSKFGIVVLSVHYIQKGWTQYELDGLFEREMVGGKTILPIWHNISKKEVHDFSPTLSNRLALNSSLLTPREISMELIKLLKPTEPNAEG